MALKSKPSPASVAAPKKESAARTAPIPASVNIDAIRDRAIAQSRELSAEICDLCALAEFPKLAADFIRRGATLASVRFELQHRRAAASDVLRIDSHYHDNVDPRETAKREADAGWEKAAAAARGEPQRP